MVNTDYENVYTAKREYDDNSVGYKLRTESGEYIGTLSDINNNRSNNENKYLHIPRQKMEEERCH